MPYFSGNASLIGKSVRKVLVTNSTINTSELDMNLKNITSVKDPIAPQDAATRRYVDHTVDRVAQDMENFFTGFIVELKGVDFTTVAHIKPGSYLVTITPLVDGFPTASFAISKASTYSAGNVMRMTAGPGMYTPEQLDLQWPVEGVLMLRKTGVGYDGEYLVDMNMKNVSAVTAPPIMPNDSATKSYVDEMIKRQLDIKFGGVIVPLNGTEFSQIINLRPGSYVIAVTPLNMDGAPTATFSVSKNSNTVKAHIMKTTGCSGLYTPEQLELTWPENCMPLLKKTGHGYNGNYLVDMNLKNFSSTPTVPNIPSDVVTVNYVEEQIEKRIQAKFGGITVELKDSNFTTVTNLRPGSYHIAITSTVENAPTATFAVSKNSPYSEPSIMVTSSCKGLESGEGLELTWPENSMLQLRKTGPFYDGFYIVDFNLKNISPNPILPQLPTDSANRAYVDHEISERLKIKFGGVLIPLVDTTWIAIAAMRPGSYLITVSPTFEGGPSASFLISKSKTSGTASVVKMTSSLGDETDETLELQWPEDSKMMLRKTGAFHDGNYLVDFNLKNFTSTAPPIMPTDSASKAYVDTQIKAEMQAKFGGMLVSLINTEFTPVTTLKPGSYFITVSPTFDGGATATFLVSKSSLYGAGSIVRMTSSAAVQTEEMLELSWPENSKILLRKTSPFHDGNYLVDFNLKNFSNLPPPIFPSDSVDRAYVDRAITNKVDVKFGGLVVNLKNSSPSEIAPLRPGSYIVSVTSYVRNGPTATFLISKSADTVAASVMKATMSPGIDTGELLELQWPDNGKLQLRKIGPFYDGDYLVDFNLKNFTTTPPPILPTDAASRAFVEKEIKDSIDLKFSGINVFLEDDRYAEITALRAGSYVITVTPTFDGGSTATFNVSKSSNMSTGMVFKSSSAPGYETEETLELQWPPNDKIYLRKTGPFHDGIYLVDFNLKNFSTAPLPIMPTDSASKSYVDNTIKTSLDVKFGGVVVTLTNMDFTPVLPMRPGSYLITITPLKEGCPTATFSISKSSTGMKGMVMKNTSCPGIDEDCQLELDWPENGKIRVRKTNPYHDGEYLVDTNLRNFTTTVEPVIPTDTATKSYVDNKILNTMDVKFSGVLVHLENDDVSDVAMIKPGSYVVTVNSMKLGGPTAIFNISKGSTGSYAMVVKTSSCPGEISEEQLELLWPENSKLLLRKTGPRYDGDYLVDFNMKNFTNLAPPVLPTDNVTKDYLESELRDRLDIKFGGVVVSLNDSGFTDVFDLRQGSYFITVSPLKNGAPTATFMVSKGSLAEAASVVKMTSCPGRNTGEKLEMVWLENKKLQLRKTGPFHDGDYLVDMNLKNFTNMPPPVIPTDVANKSFVEDTIDSRLDVKFSGILVPLVDTGNTAVTALRSGSYVITVSAVREGGPTGTFMISKASTENEGSIVAVTSCPAVDSGELIILTWPPNSKLLIRKTGPFHDGDYLVDFNLKNFTNSVPPVLPGDCATLRYVDSTIRDSLNVKFGGILVSLEGLQDTPVIALKSGSYLVTVSSMQEGGPTATFTMSKSSRSGVGSIVKISSCPGVEEQDANLELRWPENSKILLRKTTLFHDGDYLVDFNLKNFTNLPSPVLPQDVATRSYVDSTIRERMEAKFSGLIISLTNDQYSDVTVLKNGSYVITVTPLISGAPTAAFHISKNDMSMEAHVIKTTSCPGIDSGEVLELTWPAYGKLKLRKTNAFHDGDYLVDFNLKNFSNSPPPEIPSDTASVSFVNEQIQKYLNMRFTGIPVDLHGIDHTEIIALKPGAYVVGVSALFDNGPAATFAISKSGTNGEPHIIRMTSSPGANTGEQLNILWPTGGKLSLEKSGPGNNGTYLVDMNLKNITRDNAVSDDYVIVPEVVPQPQLNKGVTVLLQNDQFTDVIALNPGSYILAISPNSPSGGPTATFSISKSTPDSLPHIVKITGCTGATSDEQLEIVWPPNEMVQIRKTGLNYNGLYTLDTTLKNMTVVTESTTPQPLQLGAVLQYEFVLEGVEETRVAYLVPGSYMAFVSSFEANVLSATFGVMKKRDSTINGMIVPMVLAGSIEGPHLVEIPEIIIRWDADNELFVSKSIENVGNGVYQMKLM